jgi:hypothetical protein
LPNAQRALGYWCWSRRSFEARWMTNPKLCGAGKREYPIFEEGISDRPLPVYQIDTARM